MFKSLRLGIAEMLVSDMTRDMDEPRYWDEIGINTEAGEAVTADTLFALPTAKDCIATIAGSIASVPLEVFEVGRDGALTPASDHPLTELFAVSPGQGETPAGFWQEQITDYLSRANSYAEIVSGDRGFASELIHIAANRAAGAVPSEAGLTYRFRHVGGRGGTVDVPGYRVMHMRSSPRDESGLFGKPIFDQARDVLGKALAVHRYGARFFKNSGAAGGTIELANPFKNEDQEKRWLSTFRTWRTGRNAHSDFLMPVGSKYNRQTVNNNEAQFLETQKASDLEICRLFGVPPHKVGILENTTFNNIEHQSIQYVVDTLVPILTLYEQGGRLSLISDTSRFLLRFNIAALLRGDQATRFAAYQIGLLTGFLTINEVRRAEGLNGIGAQGDILMRPLNMDTVQVEKAMNALRAGDLEAGTAFLATLAENAKPAAFVPLAKANEVPNV